MSLSRPVLLIIAGVALLCCALLAVPVWQHAHETPPPPTPPALRLTLTPVDEVTFGAGPDHPFEVAVSPDGRRLAFPAMRGGAAQVWIQNLTTGARAALPGTNGGVLPFWSPDGTRLGFFAAGRLKALTLDGNQVADLGEAPAPRGAVWHSSGDIIMSPRGDGGLVRRRVDGSIEPLTTLDTSHGEISHRFPVLLDDRQLLFFVRADQGSQQGIWWMPLDAPEKRLRLTRADGNAIGQRDVVIYAMQDTLIAQRLMVNSGEDHPSLFAKSLVLGTGVGSSPLNQLSAAMAGDVVVFGSPQPDLRDLRWIDRRDQSQSTLAAEVQAWDLRIAPGGGPVAVTARDPQLGTLDIWTYEGGRVLPRRISQAIDIDESVAWSPDATRLAWVQAGRAIAVRGAQAQLPEQTLRKFDAPLRLWDWSRDGRMFVIGETRPGTRDDLFVVPASGDISPAAFAQTPFNERDAAVSPDGHWLAYASDESGQFEIYVDSFPTPGRRGRVSIGGGSEPRWRGDGGELFFARGSEVHGVTMSFAGERPEATGTARLFDAGGDIRAFDVTPDGQRFLVNVPSPRARPQPLRVIVNWRSLM